MRGMSEHDFDFLFGRWKGRNRRLKERLAGSNEWLEFDCTIECFPIWGGAAHYDVYEALDTPIGAIHGLTLRLYDPKSQQWAIYWANRNVGRLDPQMTGSFDGDRGEFYDQELFDGRMIYVRFIWTHEGRERARWQQAFSDDGGKTWETNWVVDFERLP